MTSHLAHFWIGMKLVIGCSIPKLADYIARGTSPPAVNGPIDINHPIMPSGTYIVISQRAKLFLTMPENALIYLVSGDGFAVWQ